MHPKSPRGGDRQPLHFERLFAHLYITNTDINKYYKKEDLPKLTRGDKIAPTTDDRMELQSALEDHFSKQKMINVGDYPLPSIRALEEQKELVKTPFSMRLEERSHQ